MFMTKDLSVKRMTVDYGARAESPRSWNTKN
jgi:hypothetical protein